MWASSTSFKYWTPTCCVESGSDRSRGALHVGVARVVRARAGRGSARLLWFVELSGC